MENYNFKKIEEVKKEAVFDPFQWKQTICEDLEKEYVCDRCKNKIFGEKLYLPVYCYTCNKYVWELK